MLHAEEVFIGPQKPIALANRVGSLSQCRERLWDNLCRSPSVLGRLVAIAELRNGRSGRYEHSLSAEFGEVPVDRTLREIHREIFDTWLSFKLQQQVRDLSIWLAWLGHGQEDGAQHLQRINGRLTGLIPLHHLEAERQLFVADLGLAIALLRMAEIEAGRRVWPSDGDAGERARSARAGGIRGWFKS